MESLPTGTVTFLFTDIEGSTALLQRLGDRRYAEVLVEHQRLLRDAFANRHGREVHAHGDAFLVAFSRARDAVGAAVAAQRALLKHAWPDGASLGVRMGLHTGEPVSGPGDYTGMDVHRAARICSAGYGGQILVSQTVADLAAPDLPPGVSLQDMGTHRLKDLREPEHLLQVVHPELPRNFPPLQSLDARPNNLPVQLTSFVGREREIAEVQRLLGAARLVTLTGSGGAGKTRLALQVAAEILEGFPDGVWLVELAALSDPNLVPKALASALGAPEQPGRSLTETLADALQAKSVLVVLDNCEHLVVACAHLTDALIRACPNVRILATSREALRVAGETTWRIPSLSIPEPQRLPPLDRFKEYEAVRLFIDRAVANAPQFTVTASNAPAIAQVCHRLDGIPLAIELAATRVKVLAVEQIVERLDDRFRLLTGGSRTALPRQQTLRAAMDWSYSLLSVSEQAVLRRLSVFVGGWTLEAAEEVCAGDGVAPSDVLDLLTQLVDKSLVVADTLHGEARHRLLETVRRYGWDRLVEFGEAVEVQQRHRDWYLRFAERADSKFFGPEQKACMEQVETELDNLRAALAWSRADEGGAESWLRLAAALSQFWFMRGYLSEALGWLDGALSASPKSKTPTRAAALCGAGVLSWRLGEARGEALLQESLALFREFGNAWHIAYVLHHLAHALQARGDDIQGLALLDESVTTFREIEDTWGVGWSLYCLGDAVLDQGDYDRATALFEQSLALCRQVGNVWTTSFVLASLGVVARHHGDYARATALLEEGLAIALQTESKYHVTWLQCELATVLLSQGDTGRTVALYTDSLLRRREIGSRRGVAQCFEGLAAVACKDGRHERAARLLGAADEVRETVGDPRKGRDEAFIQGMIASTREGLGATLFDEARAKGRAMTLEQAVEYALTGETD